MKRPRRRALKRRATPAAPSVEELTGVSISRRQAYEAGHQAALFDELNASLNEALRRNDLRRQEDLPVLPDGSLDARIHSDDNATVTMPLWAFDVVRDLVMDKMLKGSKGKGPTSRWWQKYQKDQIHWHRYALVRQALTGKRATSLDVYDVVAGDLDGTAFTAKASGIKSSVETVVAPALRNGEHVRFYRSTAHLYESMLNTPGPVTVVA
jgi:hypothetical protein